jgi:hypothetical protein
MSQLTKEMRPDLDSLPVAPSSKLSQQEEQLVERFEEIDLKSIDQLTDGGKRLVEWGTAAVGIFFAALALLSNPSVLTTFAQPLPKLFGVVAVIGYLASIVLGFFASMPKRYERRRYSLTGMQQQLDSAFTTKNRLVVSGSLTFMIATLSLGALILMVLSSL